MARRRRALPAALLIALLSPVTACAGSEDPGEAPDRPSSAAAEPSNEADRDYLVGARELHLSEIEAGRVALANGRSETVREDAARFIADHTRLDAELVEVAEQLGVPLPEEPTEQQQAELEGVAGITDDTFDAVWSAQRAGAHEQEARLVEAQDSGGLSPLVDRLVTEAEVVRESHVAELTGQPQPQDPLLGAPVPTETVPPEQTEEAEPPLRTETAAPSSSGEAPILPAPQPSSVPAQPPASVGAGFAPPGAGGTGAGTAALGLGLLAGGVAVAAAGVLLVVRDRRAGHSPAPGGPGR